MTAVKEENINRLMSAMFTLMLGMKKGVEHCCTMCGNLTEKELTIISYVGQNQNVKMSDIAENIAAPLSTLTSIVDKLVNNKYLSRYHSSEDRRAVLVALASKGIETQNIFIAHKQEMANKILGEFSLRDQGMLIKFLEKIPVILKENN